MFELQRPATALHETCPWAMQRGWLLYPMLRAVRRGASPRARMCRNEMARFGSMCMNCIVQYNVDMCLAASETRRGLQ